MTNQGGLYMTVAFSNGGNRDAALLRVEPALWSQRTGSKPEWVALSEKVHADIPVAVPKTPLVVKAGGVEIVALSTRLNPSDAERALVSTEGGTFLGLRVATMNSDGNLYCSSIRWRGSSSTRAAEFRVPRPRSTRRSAASRTFRARRPAIRCSPTRGRPSSGLRSRYYDRASSLPRERLVVLNRFVAGDVLRRNGSVKGHTMAKIPSVRSIVVLPPSVRLAWLGLNRWRHRLNYASRRLLQQAGSSRRLYRVPPENLPSRGSGHHDDGCVASAGCAG